MHEDLKCYKSQLEIVNLERAVAIKALQYIEGLLCNIPAADENVVLAYATAVEALSNIEGGLE